MQLLAHWHSLRSGVNASSFHPALSVPIAHSFDRAVARYSRTRFKEFAGLSVFSCDDRGGFKINLLIRVIELVQSQQFAHDLERFHPNRRSQFPHDHPIE